MHAVSLWGEGGGHIEIKKQQEVTKVVSLLVKMAEKHGGVPFHLNSAHTNFSYYTLRNVKLPGTSCMVPNY